MIGGPCPCLPSAKFQRSLGWLDAVIDGFPSRDTAALAVEHAASIARQALAEADAIAVENERLREYATRLIDDLAPQVAGS